MTDHELLTRTTSVPDWMVRLAIWTIGGLGSGLAITVGALVWWAVSVERRLSYVEIKQGDLVSMAASQGRDIREILVGQQQLERKVDVIDARLGRAMP